MSPLIAQSPRDRIILGLMTFGPDEAAGARVTSIDDFKKTLDVFQSRGYHEVDTARVYVGGAQEAWTRDAGWKDRGLTLATKVVYPNEPKQNEPDKVLASVEKSLKELDTDCVDILYLHAAVRPLPSPLTPPTNPPDRTAPSPSPPPSPPSTPSTSKANSSASASPTSPPSRSPKSS